MNPVFKTLLLIFGTLSSIIAIPVILILFHEYLNIFFAVFFFVFCFVLFVYYVYQELLLEIRNEYEEEQRILDQFAGDLEKIRFYRAFKKYFDGDLNAKQLEQWLLTHPSKHQ
jgi:hypothetical protein